MGSDSRVITVTRLMRAPASRVFAYLTNPANHHALDTSGMIRSAAEPRPHHPPGAGIPDDMHNAIRVDHQVANHVIAFEPDKVIGWAPPNPINHRPDTPTPGI
ncbi:hypothetical protein [Amycolatopsis sp. NPDC004378]